VADTSIVITNSALQVLEDMQKRVWDIENKYGKYSQEAEKALFTFSQMLMTIIRWPGRVTKDFAPLSLLIDSSIVIGLIWHPVKHKVDDGWVTDELLGEWSSHS
jgi:hypothetical protein